ncbi:MAG: hypothetical protein ACM3P1_01435 [Candidatus Saccharibacteria bacterium]
MSRILVVYESYNIRFKTTKHPLSILKLRALYWGRYEREMGFVSNQLQKIVDKM